ncbi:hypothetical protein ADUPG1_013503, partial [Aduncisulcus paluster]
EKEKEKERKEHKPKHDSLTLTSASTLTPQCIIGSGGFGEVLLVKVDGIPFPCVLKKMLKIADEKVVKDCRKEFKVQLKLFNNPKCFNRIPRPLYILDLLDCDMKGIYGFLMEFCVGGSVSAFSKRWCADGKYESGVDDEDSECSSSESADDVCASFGPKAMNPVKVCSLCVGMIECLDDVFTAKPKLVHRDVKPDNFLVRVDPKDGECTVVLADLGFVHIQDSISSSSFSQQIDSSSLTSKTGSKEVGESQPDDNSNCGTFVFNSYETLTEGIQTQMSDGYSLGLSILSLFTAIPPFLGHPGLRGIVNPIQFISKLSELLKSGLTPKLTSSPLFKSLVTIEEGDYKPVYECLNKVFLGLTEFDAEKRMSVHQARMSVQSIKPLLPKIGEGWKCPSIETIVSEQLKKHGGSVGTLGHDGVAGVNLKKGWDDSKL